MVEAYQWFDGRAALEGYSSAIGEDYGDRSALDDLPGFLEEADTVQVESFFAVQKLILQKAFEKIMGTGTAAERKNSRDKEVIGDLAWWIGTAPGTGDTTRSLGEASRHADADTAQKLDLGQTVSTLDIAKYATDGGFGELGSGGHRPSNIYLGFYNKLDLMSRLVDMKDNSRMDRIQGTVDPISATLNQFNPTAMIANAVQNVRIASEVHGTSAGYMWEAQLLGAVKGALPAIGAVVGSIVPGLGTAAGAALGAALGAAIASTIHVDAKTGKRDYQTTDATGVGLVVSAATWGAGAYFTGTMQTVTQYSLAAASGGMKYDENGKVTGGFDPVAAGISMAAKVAGQTAGHFFGGGDVGSFLASDITSTVLNTGVQYHNYSHGYQNNYAALANPDLTRLGALGGGLMGAVYSDSRTQESNQEVLNELKKVDPQALREAGIDPQNLPSPNDYGRMRELVSNLQGYVRRQEEEYNTAINRAYGSSNEAALDLLRAAWAADGRLGGQNAAAMEAGAAMRRVLAGDIEMITGGQRQLTNGEAMMLANKYGFDPRHLFSQQSLSQAQIFATTNYSSAYQALLGNGGPNFGGGATGGNGYGDSWIPLTDVYPIDPSDISHYGSFTNVKSKADLLREIYPDKAEDIFYGQLNGGSDGLRTHMAKTALGLSWLMSFVYGQGSEYREAMYKNFEETEFRRDREHLKGKSLAYQEMYLTSKYGGETAASLLDHSFALGTTMSQ